MNTQKPSDVPVLSDGESKHPLEPIMETVKHLSKTLYAHKNPQKASQMQQYMQNLFPFAGIQQPERKEITKSLINACKNDSRVTGPMILEFADALWELPEREFQYIALDVLGETHKKWTPEFLPFFLGLVTRKSWWDSVDTIATKLVGGYYARTGLPIDPPVEMEEWLDSDNIWQNRTALLFQLYYKEKTDIEFLFSAIERLQEREALHKEFFIQKAIGWSLRQLYRIKPNAVKNFIAEHDDLSSLAKREALKHD